MRKVTLSSFCRNADGRLNLLPSAAWTNTPFRLGRLTIATNGHLIVWRTTRPEDRVWPILTDEAEAPGDRRRANVRTHIDRHPGRGACRKLWPTACPVREGGPEVGFWSNVGRVYFPQRLRVSIDGRYRDRIARFGASVGAPVLYATPRSTTKPIAFAVGPWRGLLMPLRNR